MNMSTKKSPMGAISNVDLFVYLQWSLMTSNNLWGQNSTAYEALRYHIRMHANNCNNRLISQIWPLYDLFVLSVTFNDLWGQTNIAYDAEGYLMVMHANLACLSKFPKIDLDWPLFDLYWPLVTSKVRML